MQAGIKECLDEKFDLWQKYQGCLAHVLNALLADVPNKGISVGLQDEMQGKIVPKPTSFDSSHCDTIIKIYKALMASGMKGIVPKEDEEASTEFIRNVWWQSVGDDAKRDHRMKFWLHTIAYSEQPTAANLAHSSSAALSIYQVTFDQVFDQTGLELVTSKASFLLKDGENPIQKLSDKELKRVGKPHLGFILKAPISSLSIELHKLFDTNQDGSQFICEYPPVIQVTFVQMEKYLGGDVLLGFNLNALARNKRPQGPRFLERDVIYKLLIIWRHKVPSESGEDEDKILDDCLIFAGGDSEPPAPLGEKNWSISDPDSVGGIFTLFYYRGEHNNPRIWKTTPQDVQFWKEYEEQKVSKQKADSLSLETRAQLKTPPPKSGKLLSTPLSRDYH